MSTLVLKYPRGDAKTLVKAAFEITHGIKTYNDESVRIVGKSGASLGSYGEEVIVEIPENQSDSSQTQITVSAERQVGMNVTANPEKYKSRFLESLDTLRGHSIEHILEVISDDVSDENTKEVASSAEQVDGSNLVWYVLIATFVMFFLFILLI